MVLEGAGAARLLATEGHEDHRHAARRGATSARAVSSSTAMPDALSSAPGATATVSRWAPTRRYGDRASKPRGRATTLTDVPASTGTPHELPAGTGKDCRDTSYPRASRRPATQRAARRKAGPVASRGPTSPARNRTVRMARALEKVGTRGSVVGSTVGSSVTVAVADEGGADVGAGGDGSGSAREEDSPVQPVTRTAAAATAAALVGPGHRMCRP